MNPKIVATLAVLLLFIGLISCTGNSNETKKPNTRVKTETQPEKDSMPLTQESLDLFPELISEMKAAGFNPDTTYFDEKMYQDGDIHLVNYESHEIHQFLTDKNNFGKLSKKKYSADYDTAFSKVTDIRLFPWAKMTVEGKKRFGVVEVWTFDNLTEASKAYNFLMSELEYLGFPYPETGPLYFQCYLRLYIFHSPDYGAGVECKPFVDGLNADCK